MGLSSPAASVSVGVRQRIVARLCLRLLLVTVMLAPSFSFGTAIVILRTPDTIFVAADSMVTSSGSIAETACKVHFSEGVGFAMAGLYAEQSTGFDLMALAREASRASGTLNRKMEVFESSLRSPLLAAFESMRRHPAFPGIEYLCVDVCYFGFEDGIPKVLRLTAKAIEPRSGEIDVSIRKQSVPDAKNVEPFTLVMMAHSEAVLKILQSSKPKAPSFESFVEAVIQRSIDEASREVGPPIDVVQITSVGRKWIKRKPECAP